MNAEALAEQIVAHLDEHVYGTVQTIARAVGARDAAVRAVLNTDGRFMGPFTVGKAPRAKRVFLAPHSARDRLGRAA